MEDLLICEICKHENRGDKYGDYTCAKCGQKYSYGEQMHIVLSDEQIALLRLQVASESFQVFPQ